MRKLIATLGAALLLVVVSCSDDGDKDDATATTLDAAAAKAAYCAIEDNVDAMFNDAFSATNGTPSDEAAATVAAAVVEQYGDAALAAAPPEIADDVAVLVAATAKMAEGNPGAFDTFISETQAAGEAVAAFCGI